MNSINKQITQIKDWLALQDNLDEKNFSFSPNSDLSRSSTMRLESHGMLLKVYNISFLKRLYVEFTGERFLILGKGANSILSPNREDKIYLKLLMDKTLVDKELSELKDFYWLPASTSLSRLVVHAKTYGLEKWESLTGIPGTIGGAITMNAGTKLGEISELITAVQLIRSCGKVEEISLSDKDFSYRKNHFLRNGDIITAAKLKIFNQNSEIKSKITDYLDYRTKTQPLWEKTCGSVFKNEPHYLAGKTIDLTCLKGLRSGGLAVSDKHANFIVNRAQGNQSDFVRLTNALKTELELIYGVSFELEARFL